MHSVLFVCTGNQYRSPIAAEAFREQLIHRTPRAARGSGVGALIWSEY
jgi:protein-tyrosine-phosphatase